MFFEVVDGSDDLSVKELTSGKVYLVGRESSEPLDMNLCCSLLGLDRSLLRHSLL